MKIILGLGSNVGDRKHNLEAAISLLKEQGVLTQITVSRLYQSKALLPSGAPDDWDKHFLNMAVLGECELKPEEVLVKIKLIEKLVGRIDRGIWSPREIDIDILLYGDFYIDTLDLNIPHKFLLERDFALLPVNDLAPGWVYSGMGSYRGKTIAEIMQIVKIDKNNCEIVDIKVVV